LNEYDTWLHTVGGTQGHIPEDMKPQQHLCEDLKSLIKNGVSEYLD
jgi:hypothetical protein